MDTCSGDTAFCSLCVQAVRGSVSTKKASSSPSVSTLGVPLCPPDMYQNLDNFLDKEARYDRDLLTESSSEDDVEAMELEGGVACPIQLEVDHPYSCL